MMKLILITAILVCVVHAATKPIDQKCEELKELEKNFTCDQTEFEVYAKCIKERKEVRRKRQAICPLTGEPLERIPAIKSRVEGVEEGPDILPPIYESQNAVESGVFPPIFDQKKDADVIDPIFVPEPLPEVIQPTFSQGSKPDFVEPVFETKVPQRPQEPQPDIVAPIFETNEVHLPVQPTVPTVPKVRPIPAPLEPETPLDSRANYSIIYTDDNDPAYHQVIVKGENVSHYHRQPLRGPANITTVIRLTNLINNTNVVNVPTNINSTNINNITIFTNTSDDSYRDRFGFGFNDDGPCCLVVRPKSCHSSGSGYRCHHKRHKTCGSQCTSRVIHAQSRRHGGRHGVTYVPEPNPKCHYVDYWPYVACGRGKSRSCAGCYDHYGYGHQSYYQPDPSCDPCYDDGFDYGQLYRRGPVMRPYYYHEPPCYLTGACMYGYGPDPYAYPPPCGPYGCFGDEYIDPVWGHRQPPADYDLSESAVIVDDDEDAEERGSLEEKSDWAVVAKKCRVVKADGSVEIRNCTEAGEHPYATAPLSRGEIPPMELDGFNDGFRRARSPPIWGPYRGSMGRYGRRYEPRWYVENVARGKVHRKRSKGRSTLVPRPIEEDSDEGSGDA